MNYLHLEHNINQISIFCFISVDTSSLFQVNFQSFLSITTAFSFWSKILFSLFIFQANDTIFTHLFSQLYKCKLVDTTTIFLRYVVKRTLRPHTQKKTMPLGDNEQVKGLELIPLYCKYTTCRTRVARVACKVQMYRQTYMKTEECVA